MRSVFYGVLLTVFVVCAGYVQAANDQDYISISDEPAFKPKSTVYSDKKKKTKSSTGDDYISISDEPAFTPKPSSGIADGNASADNKGKGHALSKDVADAYFHESSEGIDQAYPVRPAGDFDGAGFQKMDRLKVQVVTDEDN